MLICEEFRIGAPALTISSDVAAMEWPRKHFLVVVDR